MAQNEVKGWDKVVAWYASKSYAVNMVYSAGASIVIIGALFKIMHWPGAGIVLTIGMCTEAVLFMIGIFEKPHAVYNWENVFPQLLGHDAKPMVNLGGGAANASAPALAEDDAKSLKESIANIANTANALTDLSKLAEGTNKLSEKLNAAAQATEQFGGAQQNYATSIAQAADKFGGAQQGLVDGIAQAAQAAEKLGANYTSSATAAKEAADATVAASKSAAAVAQNLASINAAYEMQAKAAQAGAKDAEAFATAQQKLAQQVADLNKVYGNMLNALA